MAGRAFLSAFFCLYLSVVEIQCTSPLQEALALVKQSNTNPYSDSVHARIRRFLISFNGWTRDTSKNGFTTAEKTELIRIHNVLRRVPTATNMRYLAWDLDLEKEAQEWANGCDFRHNYGNTYGETLSAQPGYYNGKQSVIGWFKEGLNYSYKTSSCTPNATCAHYTQVVLAESKKFGCGINFCPLFVNISLSTIPRGYYTVCNYDPATNKGSSVPYENGTRCSNCPDDMPVCENGLCHHTNTRRTTSDDLSTTTEESVTTGQANSTEVSTTGITPTVDGPDSNTATVPPETEEPVDENDCMSSMFGMKKKKKGKKMKMWSLMEKLMGSMKMTCKGKDGKRPKHMSGRGKKKGKPKDKGKKDI